jgi:hypothetical protein
MRQAIDSARENTSELAQKSGRSPSPERSLTKDRAKQFDIVHLFSNLVGERRPEPHTEGFLSVLTGSALSHPANSPMKKQAFLQIQQNLGNRYVQRLVRESGRQGPRPALAAQAKLEIGQPGDIYEREADSVAERVMRMPEPCIQLTPT